MGVLSCIIDAFLPPYLPSESRERGRILIPPIIVLGVVFFLWSVVAALSIAANHYVIATDVAVITALVVVVVFLVYARVMRRVTIRMAQIFGAMGIVVVIISNSRGNQTWHYSILVMDLMLLVKVPKGFPDILVCTMVVWLIVRASEDAVRWGLYDVWGGEIDVEPDGWGRSLTTLLSQLVVFILDFLMTRRFADGMHEEQERMRSATILAEMVAEALVMFDLKQAEELLEEASQNSACDSMIGPFRSLLDNLVQYRPYLPESLFYIDDTSTRDDSREARILSHVPPPTEWAAIVFTDIQCSTMLWEKFPIAMEKALHIHNTTLRQVAARNNGYEVKTIGDAFMLAFSTIEDAVSFCIEGQCELLEAPWPSDLLKDPVCSVEHGDDDLPIWKGLRVRMGLNAGPVKMKVYPITQRADYHGTVVNLAARCESACEGGFIALPSSLASNVDFAGLGAVCYSLGVHTLKGIGSVELTAVLPARLADRKSKSVRPVRLPSSEPSAANNALRVRVGFAEASMACVKTDFRWASESAAERINALVVSLSRCAEETGGLVSVVTGSLFGVSWNAGKRNREHVVASARFASLIRNDTLVKERSVVGIATGRVAHGNLGGRQKFAVVMGGPIDLAMSLASGAREIGTFCLLAGVGDVDTAANDATLQPYVRPVWIWEHIGGGQTKVYELMVGMDREGELDYRAGGLAHTQQYAQAFDAACADGDMTALEKYLKVTCSKCPNLAEMYCAECNKELFCACCHDLDTLHNTEVVCQDNVLQRAVELMERSRPRTPVFEIPGDWKSYGQPLARMRSHASKHSASSESVV